MTDFRIARPEELGDPPKGVWFHNGPHLAYTCMQCGMTNPVIPRVNPASVTCGNCGFQMDANFVGWSQ